MREFIDGFLNENQDEFKKRVKKLSDKDYTRLYSDLIEYNTPKLARTEIAADQNALTIKIIDGDSSTP